jgi:crossover junction endodeoxyribonuclease RuvC
LPVYECARHIKKAVVGGGTERAVKRMVQMILGVRDTADAADALAAAICHAHGAAHGAAARRREQTLIGT